PLNVGSGCFSVNGTCIISGAGLGTNNTWTALQTFNGGLIAGNATTTNATTTNISISGIASTSKLTVSNNATSSFGGGINLSSGCFAVNGNCIGSGGGTLTGSGAINLPAVWSSGTGLIASGSPVVGIVTATSTNASSTFANGINLTAGCFS